MEQTEDPIEFIHYCGTIENAFPIELRILMIGLDNSGKTSILYTLMSDYNIESRPTIGFNTETIVYNNYKLSIWDVGGQEKIRPLWKHYYQNTDVIIFVVDASDWTRIDMAKEELHKTMCSDELQNCPLLVLANKQDIKGALSVERIVERLGLSSLQRKWFVHACCGSKKQSLFVAMDWLTNLTPRYNLKNQSY